jgi:hypothetical protein
MLSPTSRYAAALAGDHYHGATRSVRDVVRDLGTGNRVTGPGSVVTAAAPADGSAGSASATGERAGAAQVLGERFGARGLLQDREAMRVAPR